MVNLIKVSSWNKSNEPAVGHVVYVHGLGGHPYNSWRRNGDTESFWPLWLAEDLKGVSIWTLSYPAPPTNWLGTAMPLQDRAVGILERLSNEPEFQGKPIAFICHSLGGLLVKQVLREANDQRKQSKKVEIFLNQVKSVIFIGTPHSGSVHANLLDRLRLICWPSTASMDLVKNNSNLRSLNVWYRNWSNHISHKIFYETHGTAVGTIVDAGSADAGLSDVRPIGIDDDHIGMCKPNDRDALIYNIIKGFLSDPSILKLNSFSNKNKLKIHDLPIITTYKLRNWAPILTRLFVLVIFVVVVVKGITAMIWPVNSLQSATIHQIEQSLQQKSPQLSKEQIDRFIASLHSANGEPSFESAKSEAAKGNARIAEGILKQIFDNKQIERDKAAKAQAEAARNLAAVAVISDATEGLNWYRRAVDLDSNNIEGWLELGDAALLGGTIAEAKTAYLKVIALAQTSVNVRSEGIGYDRLGDLQIKNGDLPAALRSYEYAMQISNRLLSEDPKNLELIKGQSIAHNKIGDLHKTNGKFELSLESYMKSLQVAEYLAKISPKTIEVQRALYIGKNKVGDMQKRLGQKSNALKTYLSSLSIVESLAATDLEDTEKQYHLSVTIDRVGNAQSTPSEALIYYLRSLAIAEKLVENDPNNLRWKNGLLQAHLKVGDVYKKRNSLEEALESYESTLIITKQLVEADPDNVRWQYDLSISQGKVGMVYESLGNIDSAIDFYTASLDTISTLARQHPNNSDYRSMFGLTKYWLQELHKKRVGM